MRDDYLKRQPTKIILIYLIFLLFLNCSGFLTNIKPRDPVNELFSAISECNFNKVNSLLTEGVPADIYNKYGQTPLMRAVTLKKGFDCDTKPVMLLLIKNGADVNARDLDGDTALRFAVGSQEIFSIRFLLDHGANPGLKNLRGYGSLGKLSIYDRTINTVKFKKIISLIINAKNQISKEEATRLLLWAIKNNELTLAKDSLTLGADPLGKDLSKYISNSPIVISAEEGNWQILRLLIQQNIPHEYLKKAAFKISKTNTIPVLKILLKHGVQVNETNELGWSLLVKFMTSYYYNTDLTSFLIANGANPYSTLEIKEYEQEVTGNVWSTFGFIAFQNLRYMRDDGTMPYKDLIAKNYSLQKLPLSEQILIASFEDDIATLKKALLKKPNLQSNSLAGVYSLFHAVNRNDISSIKLIIEAGAHVNSELGGCGVFNTPLMSAIRYRKIEAAKVLLKYGANPNFSRTRGNDTILMKAVSRNNIEAVKLLLMYGAQPIITKNGSTIELEIAKKNKFNKIKLLLESKNELLLKNRPAIAESGGSVISCGS